MTKIVNIPQEVVNKVQRYDVEMCSRRDIIAFILSKNIDIPEGRFNKYQDDYSDAYLAFESAKHDIETNFVDPNMADNEKKISWKLDYHTCELTINYEEV